MTSCVVTITGPSVPASYVAIVLLLYDIAACPLSDDKFRLDAEISSLESTRVVSLLSEG